MRRVWVRSLSCSTPGALCTTLRGSNFQQHIVFASDCDSFVTDGEVNAGEAQGLSRRTKV